MHNRHAFSHQQFGNEILIARNDFALLRLLADGLLAGRIDIEGAFRRRAGQEIGLIEHRNHEIAALLEGRLEHWQMRL